MTPESILVLAPNWLGDAAMSTPALRALHRRFPDAALTVIGREPVCDLLRGLPWIHDCVAAPRQPGPGDMVRLRREVYRKRSRRADLAVVLPHSFRAAVLAFALGARRRLGYARNGRSPLLTDAVQAYREDGRIRPIYMALEYSDLVKTLGCEDDGQGLELAADADAVQAVREHLAGQGPLVGLVPGAAFGPSKRWPADRFAAVADSLAERAGARCVLLTAPGEEETRDAVIAAAKTPIIRYDRGTPGVGALKAVIAQLALLVCNDTGPRHVAVAFKVPTVCTMGPTSPRYSEGPYETGRVLQVAVDCGPCQKAVCDTDHRCMTQISVEQVADAACEVLSGSHGTRQESQPHV